jgi:nucleoside-diphosphate-sugar epimerase
MSIGRVLVTGASGFVGRGLTAGLAARSVPLTLATRGTAATAEAGRRYVQVGEIGSATPWGEALEGVGAVVHLAGHVHIAPEKAEREAALFDEVNRAGSLRLFEAAAGRGAKLFVFMSSINVLGTSTVPGQPFSDASPPDPTTPYARSKHAAERALVDAASKSDTTLVILRPPLICGPGVRGNLGRLARLASLPLPLPLGDLQNRRTLLSLDNLVSAIAAILDRGADAPAGTYVIGDRRPVSTSDIVRSMREGRGWPHLLLPAPLSAIRRALESIGAAGAYTRLFGDLEVDSRRFREAFAWSDVTDTLASLRRSVRPS